MVAAQRLLRHPAARRRLLIALTSGLTAVLSLVVRLAGRPRRDLRSDVEGRVDSAVTMPLGRLAELRLPQRDQVMVLLLALLNWLADAACLAVAVAAVGAPVPWQGLLLAFAAAAGVTSLGLTPGGIGLVEVALTGALVTAGLEVHRPCPRSCSTAWSRSGWRWWSARWPWVSSPAPWTRRRAGAQRQVPPAAATRSPPSDSAGLHSLPPTRSDRSSAMDQTLVSPRHSSGDHPHRDAAGTVQPARPRAGGKTGWRAAVRSSPAGRSP